MTEVAALLFSFIAVFAILWMPLAWLACAIFCGIIAREKRYSGFSWFLLGMLFGPLTLIATVGLPTRAPLVEGGSASRRLEPTV